MRTTASDDFSDQYVEEDAYPIDRNDTAASFASVTPPTPHIDPAPAGEYIDTTPGSLSQQQLDEIGVDSGDIPPPGSHRGGGGRRGGRRGRLPRRFSRVHHGSMRNHRGQIHANIIRAHASSDRRFNDYWGNPLHPKAAHQSVGAAHKPQGTRAHRTHAGHPLAQLPTAALIGQATPGPHFSPPPLHLPAPHRS